MIAGVGGILYKLFNRDKAGASSNADAAPVYSSGVVRNAGPQGETDAEHRKWDKVDEQVDESFPASDPPSNY
tara:strand:- start:11 stop:226 length:216 start_codon:yes stop_codon:yes gene_type:complete